MLSGVPFHPPFRVVVPDAVKNGEVLQFSIKVYKVMSGSLNYSSLMSIMNFISQAQRVLASLRAIGFSSLFSEHMLSAHSCKCLW